MVKELDLIFIWLHFCETVGTEKSQPAPVFLKLFIYFSGSERLCCLLSRLLLFFCLRVSQ
jgi:hypothetical protein